MTAIAWRSVVVAAVLSASALPAAAQEIELELDGPEKGASCPVALRFVAAFPAKAGALRYRFLSSDGTATPFTTLPRTDQGAREVVYSRVVGDTRSKSVRGWTDLEFGEGDRLRKVRRTYAVDCGSPRARMPGLAKSVLQEAAIAGGEHGEGDLLEEFDERYLERRGLSAKRNATKRLESWERLREMRKRLDRRHVGVEWLDSPGAGRQPGVLDANQCAWSSIGPTNINGRVTGIAIDPTNNQRLFVTTVGGVWRSVDGARRWERVSDDFLATVFGSVAVNPSTPAEVFIGGGDPNYHAWWRGGLGIWRSTAKGDPGTWVKVSPPGLDNQVIYRILVDPSPPNDVYAATSAGVFVGTHSGAAITFARLGTLDAWVNDIAVDFGASPRLVYAGVRTATASFTRGVWKYDGTTWNDRSTGIATATSRTITLALAPGNPSVLFAKVEATDGTLQAIYRTASAAETPMGGGNAWTAVAGGATLNDSCAGTFCYSWYNAALAVDPANADLVWGGALSIYRTTNAGAAWTNVGGGVAPSIPVGVHADHHAIALDPANPKIVYVGNDGGLFKSTDTSLASWHWNDVSHGMIVTEYYRATSQQASAFIMAGGTQDNGTLLTFGNRTWYQPGGCDGSDVAIDAANASTVYGNCNGGLYELANPVPGTAGGGSTIPWTKPAGANIASPLVTDDSVAGGALAASFTQPLPTDPRVFRLVRTTDGVNWSYASPALAANVGIAAIGIAPSSAFATYYMGIGGGAIWRTTDAGVNWTMASTGLAGAVNAISVDATDATRALASTTAGVFLTVDTGANWTAINGTGAGMLPTSNITGALFDPSAPNTIYAVTDIGAFRGTLTPAAGMTPATAAWVPYDEGLPDGLDINDLWVNRATKTLKIGTMGHGAYQRDIRPAITCPAARLLVRDNVFDGGATPSPSGVPDPEHPIPDPARPGFYKPDDTNAGRVYWWQSADIRIDVPSAAPAKNQIANGDHVEIQTCPIHLADCPAGTIRDGDPQRGVPARVYANVSNAGLAAATNVRVIAMYADASSGLPPLPPDFWTTTFPAASTTCGALDSSTGWHLADAASPCKVIPVVNPDLPEAARFDWTPPMGQATHSCMLVIVESGDDPLDASIRATNEVNVNTLVPGHRHVTLRNLHVVDAPPAPAGGGTPRMETMHVRNPDERPSRVQLWVSRAALPKDASLQLSLPTSDANTKGARRLQGFSPAALREARALKVDVKSVYAIADPAEAVLEFTMPARADWVVAWAVVPGSLKRGESARWSVVERIGDRVVGGNTYIVRATPK